MAEKGHPGFANTDEERRQQNSGEGGHASHEKGATREFGDEGADGGRRGSHTHSTGHPGHGAHGSAGGAENNGGEAGSMTVADGNQADEGGEVEHARQRGRRTRGGTHDQHVTAGKKGGSRIRQLIELGYKYEQEHGIGPGQNERSKLAAKRRAAKTGGGETGENE